MAYELHGILTGVTSPTLEAIPAYGGGPESFLNNVVTPIYRVICDVSTLDLLYAMLWNFPISLTIFVMQKFRRPR